MRFLFSCGEYQRIYKKGRISQKRDKAMQLFAKKDFARSVQLLEQVKETWKVRDSLEDIYYHMAMCYFELKDYPYASLFFKDYTDNFTHPKRTIECSYMALYCDFLAIGPSDLDQHDTKKVIEALQLFTNFYSDSEYAERCTEHIDALRKKLQKKEYDLVLQYYKMSDFKSAVTAAKNAVKLYPDMEQREEIEWISVNAQYLYAENSIKSKKLDRLKLVIENIQDYLYIHPRESKHYQEVQKIKSLTEKKITEIESIL
jgi:outer membrane protein assembly factor BamD